MLVGHPNSALSARFCQTVLADLRSGFAPISSVFDRERGKVNDLVLEIE